MCEGSEINEAEGNFFLFWVHSNFDDPLKILYNYHFSVIIIAFWDHMLLRYANARSGSAANVEQRSE